MNSEFDEVWWDKFSQCWNISPHPECSEALAFSLKVNDAKSVRLELSVDGICTISPLSSTDQIPSFTSDSRTWKNVLLGNISIEKAVLAGDVEFIGPMRFLTENWPVLRAVVACAGMLVHSVDESNAIVPTDVMVFTKSPDELKKILQQVLALRVDADEQDWIALSHSDSNLKIVLAKRPIPYASMAIGCRVANLSSAIDMLTKAIPKNNLQVSTQSGYAHVSVYGELHLLIYEEK